MAAISTDSLRDALVNFRSHISNLENLGLPLDDSTESEIEPSIAFLRQTTIFDDDKKIIKYPEVASALFIWNCFDLDLMSTNEEIYSEPFVYQDIEWRICVMKGNKRDCEEKRLGCYLYCLTPPVKVVFCGFMLGHNLTDKICVGWKRINDFEPKLDVAYGDNSVVYHTAVGDLSSCPECAVSNTLQIGLVLKLEPKRYTRTKINFNKLKRKADLMYADLMRLEQDIVRTQSFCRTLKDQTISGVFDETVSTSVEKGTKERVKEFIEDVSSIYDIDLGLTKCSVCLDSFKNPVSLECGHVFCEPCGYLECCPICRKSSRFQYKVRL